LDTYRFKVTPPACIHAQRYYFWNGSCSLPRHRALYWPWMRRRWLWVWLTWKSSGNSSRKCQRTVHAFSGKPIESSRYGPNVSQNFCSKGIIWRCRPAARFLFSKRNSSLYFCESSTKQWSGSQSYPELLMWYPMPEEVHKRLPVWKRWILCSVWRQ
jgi:hypothetical protein